MSRCKCLLLGDGGTGKTSFIKRLTTGEFSTTYSATVGYEVHHLTIIAEALATKLDLQVWDVSGQTSSGQLLAEIMSNAHCAIIVFDVTSRITFNNVAIWYREIVCACGPNIPVVIVGNKIDMPTRKVKTEAMLRKFSNGIKCYDISVKTQFNIEQPILWIAAQLLQSLHTQLTDKSSASQLAPEDLKLSGKELMGQKEAAIQDDILMPLHETNVASHSEKNSEEQSKRTTQLRKRKGSNEFTSSGVLKNHSSAKKVNNKQTKQTSK